MKNLYSYLLLIVALFTAILQTSAEEKQKEYSFTEIKKLPISSIKNQYRTGTCWSFSVLSVLESEIMTKGFEEIDLSDMFIVRTAYSEKAIKYVRMHGSLKFSGGGALDDPIKMMKKYGIVPEETYTGLKVGEKNHNHHEMDEILKGYVDKIVDSKDGKLSPVWNDGFESLLDTYLGEIPESFEYKGETHTPNSFLAKYNINLDDYVLISSFSHHPFYEKFILEVPDNWSWGEAYNLPLEDLKQTLYYAIEHDHTLAWATDISDIGFQYRKSGIAIVPETDWYEMTDEEMDNALSYPVPQKEITQELRQVAFDTYETQDDHGMQIYGIAKDQDGNNYFIIKNSWGVNNSKYDGILYASESYILYKALSILLNKNGIPEEIRKKLGL
ncbi:aminopeptidase C [Bacteroidota bacterium]